MRADGDRAPAPSLDATVREMVRQEVRAAVREAIQDAPGHHPLEMTIARWARSRGHGYATARRWVRAAGLEPAPSGKYRVRELDSLPRAPSVPKAAVADLATVRARAALDSLKGGSR